MADSEFEFTPSCGVLGPQESKEVAVLFKPSESPRRVRTALQCDVKNGKTRYVEVLALLTLRKLKFKIVPKRSQISFCENNDKQSETIQTSCLVAFILLTTLSVLSTDSTVRT